MIVVDVVTYYFVVPVVFFVESFQQPPNDNPTILRTTLMNHENFNTITFQLGRVRQKTHKKSMINGNPALTCGDKKARFGNKSKNNIGRG